MGAIAAVALAYATDITPPEKLGKTMAILGASIGIAFVLSLILGPLLANWVGVAGLFALIALLAAAALAASLRLPAVARPTTSGKSYNAKPVYQAAATIFTLHAIFTATFLVLPPLLVAGGIEKAYHWWLYLPANLIALAFMRPKNQPHPLTFGINFLILAAGAALLAVPIAHTAWLLAALTVYFIAFYRLETGLPHWVAQNAAPDSRGKAMGIYSSAQFIGSFIGGAVGGRLWHTQSPGVVLTALAIASAVAALILLKMGKTATLRGANEP